jgi:uncharacterized membrane protein YecN with MAPEG domain
MKIIVPITAVTAIVLVPIYIRLAFRVIALRQTHKVAVGAGNHSDLEMAIRAHGNFSEYVPFALLLILSAEFNGSPVWLVSFVAVMLIVGRLIHATAIPSGNLTNRVRGMKLTFAALALGAVANFLPLALMFVN